jgi:nitronate monooxygenase
MPAMSATWTSGRLQDLLGVRYPIVQGPFGGGLSSVALAAAVTRAGGLGSFGAHVLTPQEITELVADLRASAAGPFSVNLWVPQPGESQARLTDAEHRRQIDRLRPYLDLLGLPTPENGATETEAPGEPAAAAPTGYAGQVEALLRAAPPVVSFVMGVPSAAVVDEARRRGIVTIGTANTVEEAVALERAGLDAVVASGSDAGGHRGAFLRPVAESLVGTFSLVPQVVDAVSVPVIAAGGVADARGVVAALALGADGVQIGTGFLATHESAASPVHKQALLEESARTTVLTRVFSGRPARAIPNRFQREMAAFEDDVPPYPLQNQLTHTLRAAANERGLTDYVHLWAGQAASLATSRAAADYLTSLVRETRLLLDLDA